MKAASSLARTQTKKANIPSKRWRQKVHHGENQNQYVSAQQQPGRCLGKLLLLNQVFSRENCALSMFLQMHDEMLSQLNVDNLPNYGVKRVYLNLSGNVTEKSSGFRNENND